MFLHVSAEERGIGEPELIADLLDAIIGLLQIIADVLEHMFRNPFIGCLTGIFRSCLIEQLLNSKKVKIDGLGIFYCTIEGKGEADPEKFNVAEHIKALHIRFLPEQEQEMDISSRQFLKKAKFISVDSLGGTPAPEPEQEGD